MNVKALFQFVAGALFAITALYLVLKSKMALYITGAHNKLIAITFGKRNARLVESAPEMFALVKRFCKDSECDGDCANCYLAEIYEHIEYGNEKADEENYKNKTLKDILKEE